MVLNRIRQSIRQSIFGQKSDWDFQDRQPAAGRFSRLSELEPYQPSHLTRNETERIRLQGLMALKLGGQAGNDTVLSPRQRFRVWMVNEGGRRFFFSIWILLHALLFGFGFVNYQLKDNLMQARAQFHITYSIARASAFVLHFDVAFLLLPVCRNFISVMRRTPLGGVIPFDKNITFHKAVAWSIVFFTFVHIAAHMVNFIELAKSTRSGIVGFLSANFMTGPGATGWIMTAALGVMVFFAVEKRRRANFERFWYSHHLFIIFFLGWQLHGMFCLIKPDRPPYCGFIGVFWKYWLLGGGIYIYERILREVRARHRTVVSKVIQHPGKVIEIQIKKEKTETRAGQYIFLNCPEISLWQWHPFTLTSAPEEDFISVHNPTAKSGRPTDVKDGGFEKSAGAFVINPPLHVVLPRLMIDGPFGSSSEDFYKYEVVMLCSAGVGVTPFASILKSIWYRKHAAMQGRSSKPTRLLKVYFFWVCRDYDAFEWFASLLAAIEEQDLQNFVEIHTYLTAKVKDDEMNNIVVSDVGGEHDAITRLRSPTHYGRPHWDRIFMSVKEKHPRTDVAVLFCGPKVLGSTLHGMCTKYTEGEPDGTHFVWGTETF